MATMFGPENIKHRIGYFNYRKWPMGFTYIFI